MRGGENTEIETRETGRNRYPMEQAEPTARITAVGLPLGYDYRKMAKKKLTKNGRYRRNAANMD